MSSSESQPAHSSAAAARCGGFYHTSGTLPDGAPSYIERAADREVREALLRGEFCYVLTSRQMGKSSLMVHAAARLREAGVAVAILDLTALGRNLTAEQWYEGLLGILGGQLGLRRELDEFWRENRRLGPLRRWMWALEAVVLPAVGVGCRVLGVGEGRPQHPTPDTQHPALVIFIDEVDAVRSLPFSGDEFFAAIRECYNRRAQDAGFSRLTFCLLGVASPAQLIQDTRTTPFNVGRSITLTDFTAAEAAPLAAGLSPIVLHERHEEHEGSGADGARGEGWLSSTSPTARGPSLLLKRILYWTGGHPYLTQRLCQAAAEADLDSRNPISIDGLCEALFLSYEARARDDNLLFVRERLLKSEEDRAALLELYARVRRGPPVADDETNELVGMLRLTGIVRAAGVRGARGRYLRVRNRIYERVFDAAWVAQHMPDAELRRQRAAYRRGVLRTASVAAAILAVTAGLALTAMRQRQIAEAQREQSQARLVALNVANGTRLMNDGDLLGSLPWFVEALRLDQGNPARETIDRTRLAAVLRQSPRLAQMWFRAAMFVDAEFSPDGRRVLTASDAYPRKEGGCWVWDAATGRQIAHVKQPGGVPFASFSPDGKRIVTVNAGKTARVWDAATGEPITPPLHHQELVKCAVFSPDGRRVATASNDKTIRVWDARTGRPLTPPLRHDSWVMEAVFSPDGQRVMTAWGPNSAYLWDIETGKRLPLRLSRGAVGHAEFSPDGRRILTSGQPFGARIWDAASGKPLTPFFGARAFDAETGQPLSPRTRHRAGTAYASFSPDGRRIVTASPDHTAQVWDAATGQAITPPLPHGGEVKRAAFSPDGRRVVTASADGTARVWDAETGDPVTPPLRHGNAVWRVSFSPDSHSVLSTSWDGAARLWDITGDHGVVWVLRHGGPVWGVSFSPDGRRVLTRSGDGPAGEARVWNCATGQPVTPLLRHAGSVLSASFSPDGRRVVTGSGDKTARVWDAATGTPITPPLKHLGGVWRAAFSPDGRRIVTASGPAEWHGSGGEVRIWNAATGRPILSPIKLRQAALDAAFSPDGGRIVVATGLGSVVGEAQVWDAAAGRPLTPPLKHNGRVEHAAFSPDGHSVLTASWDRTARVWDAATGRPITPPLTHGNVVRWAAFSPDGCRVITASDDQTARVWDVSTGRPLTPPLRHGGSVWFAAFSPDGCQVVTTTLGPNTGSVSEARVWDAATGEPITPPLVHGGGVSEAAFSPDGRRLATASANYPAPGEARIWDLPRDDRPIGDLRRLAELLSGCRLEGAAGSMPLDPERAHAAWEALRAK